MSKVKKNKKENRYNAYMKRTESGIIVKTVDSVTGFESLIKFTSDSLKVPKDVIGNSSSGGVFRHITKKSSEDKSTVNQHNTFVKRNSGIITKLNSLTPLLRELETNIPGFYVYEDSSSTLDSQNPNVIFIANSKLNRNSVVNLNIPGNLRNVCYQGVLNKNGTVQFKAESVIKPLTIIIGEYAIKINICHNIMSPEDVGNENKLQHEDDRNPSHSGKESSKSLREEQCTEVREACIKLKTNEINSGKPGQYCSSQIDDETAEISDCFDRRLKYKDSSESVKFPSHVDNNEKGKGLESLVVVSESSMYPQNCCNKTDPHATGLSLDESTMIGNEHSEVIEIKPSPSVDLEMINDEIILINKFNSNSDQKSENVNETNVRHAYPSDCHIQPNGMFLEQHETSKSDQLCTSNCVLSVSNNDESPNDSNDSKIKKSFSSTNSAVNSAYANNLSVRNNLETMTSVGLDNAPYTTHNTEEKENKRPSSSNMLLLEIKKKLSETTASLHKLYSAFQLMDNFSERSVSEDIVGINKLETDSVKLNNISRPYETTQRDSNKIDVNSSTNILYSFAENSKSDIKYLYSESSINKSYVETSDQSQNNNTFSRVREFGCEEKDANEEIFISKEVENSVAAKSTSTIEQSNHVIQSLCGSSKFGDMKYVLPLTSKGIHQRKTATTKKTDKKLDFNSRKLPRSFTNLSEATTSFLTNDYKTGGTSNKPNNKLINYSENPQNLLEMTYQDNVQMCESHTGAPGKSNKVSIDGNSAIIRSNYLGFHNNSKSYNDSDNMSNIACEKTYTCMRCDHEFDGGSNLEQENQIEDPRKNSNSINSIKTIYVKSDFASSNCLSLPNQDPSIKVLYRYEDKIDEATNDVPLSTNSEKNFNKSSCKTFSQKIKEKLSKLKKDLWNSGTKRNDDMGKSGLKKANRKT